MFVADLHIHSAYSRATSPAMEPVLLDKAARQKGVALVAGGDFTHAAYRREMQEKLIPAEDGLYQLKEEFRQPLAGALAEAGSPRFIVSGEISCIYKKAGRVRKVHNLILLPGLEQAAELSARLEARGCNLRADGRPIIGMDSRDLLELTLEVSPEALFIPAHIWTPHFSLFGAYSGFDAIEECFEDLTPHIYALETGLSSDPPMNWRISALDRFALISNSDSHSPARLGREANIFTCEMSYSAIHAALSGKNPAGLWGTLEFFPEEGKYHFDGHRNCHVSMHPVEAAAMDGLCPVCGKPMTVGVLARAEALADRPTGYRPAAARPYESLTPLDEVIASASGVKGTASAKVQKQYTHLLEALGPELPILRSLPIEEIRTVAGPCVAESIRRLRAGEARLTPGYDGEYGRVTLLTPAEIDTLTGQDALFADIPAAAGAEKKSAAPKRRKESAAISAQSPASSLPFGLDAQQYAAAQAKERTVAVIAGPGSGKTRTLISRIALLIENGVAPESITAVTFTNKAAGELRQRLREQLKNKRAAAAVHTGTFHSISLELLRETGDRRSVLDQEEALAILDQLRKETGVDTSPRDLLTAISRYKSGQHIHHGEAGDPPPLFDRYQAELAAFSAMDFDDILLAASTLPEAVYASRCRQLLVDEYQDVNPIQQELVALWGKNADSLFVIGDPDQSIYGFRGASADCFRRLEERDPALCKIYLDKNYRSAPEIVDAASALIAANPGQRQITAAGKPTDEKPRLIPCTSPLAEGIFIADEIGRLCGGLDMVTAHQGGSEAANCSFNDVVVLYRTHRQSEQIAYCLEKAGIPYTVTGREDFWAAEPVRDSLAFFRLLLNAKDRPSLRRNLRRHGAQTAAIAKLTQGKVTAGATALIKMLHKMDDPGCRGLAAEMEAFLPQVRKSTPEVLLQSWIDLHFLGGISALERLLEAAMLHRTMADLLAAAESREEADISRCGGRPAPEAVRLMTLHAAKGLEAPVVFLAGVKEGLLPMTTDSTDIEEERRLCFVGMTRASRLLYLCAGDPESQFAKDIPPLFLTATAQPKRRPKARQLTLFDV